MKVTHATINKVASRKRNNGEEGWGRSRRGKSSEARLASKSDVKTIRVTKRVTIKRKREVKAGVNSETDAKKTKKVVTRAL